MATYSMAEAKSRFSEVLRRVRDGERVVITWHGRAIAQVIPVESSADPMEARWAELEAAGLITPAVDADAPLSAGPPSPGALARFLESRE